MKDREIKIERVLPSESVPGYLRHLADALEKKTANLPAELANLSGTVTRLKLKGQRREGVWEFKLKVRTLTTETADPREGLRPERTENNGASNVKPDIPYTELKKGMKTAFKAIGASLGARQLPDADVLNGFLADAEMMMTYAGARYGQSHYPDFREACRRLSEAYATQDIDAVRSSYTALSRLKNACHKAFK
jgi:XXXCH domain-containing protein